MKQVVLILLTVIGSILGLLLYCLALIDCVQDYNTGVYTANPLQAFLEVTAVVLYTCAGFEFFKRKVVL